MRVSKTSSLLCRFFFEQNGCYAHFQSLQHFLSRLPSIARGGGGGGGGGLDLWFSDPTCLVQRSQLLSEKGNLLRARVD